MLKDSFLLRIIFVGIFFFFVYPCVAETITITTYYPSPTGVYDRLRTVRDTYLATGNGNVGIGTITPTYKLDVVGNSRFSGSLSVTSLLLASSDVQLATASGNVGIGTTSPAFKLQVSGKVGFLGLGAGTGTALHLSASGEVMAASSSQRYKKDIVDLEFDTEKVYHLRPVSFTWKEQGNRDFGLIAEEVNEILPEVVVYDNENLPNGVKYEQLSVLLLAEMKKLKEITKQQEERISVLEKKIQLLGR